MTALKTSTQTYELDHALVLITPDDTPIAARGQQLILTQTGDRWSDCQLVITVDWPTYQHIEQATWFHLQPGMRGPQSGDNFQSDAPVILQLGILPQKLATLNAIGHQPAFLIEYLHRWQHALTAEPLQQSEAWLAREVSQHLAGRTIGFRTYWVYAPTHLLNDALAAGETAVQDITNFWQTMTTQGWEAASQHSWQLPEEVEQWLTNLATLDPQMGLSRNALMQVAVAFFKADAWPYEQVDDHTITTQYQGQNGPWVAYVRVREQPPQMLFYSLYPQSVPPECRAAMSEFVTRANSGVFIGNFEMDWEDGELRYKTSVDVLKNQINVQLLRRLVTLNVAMLDEYWPGIEAVIADDRSPVDAIALIEQ